LESPCGIEPPGFISHGVSELARNLKPRKQQKERIANSTD
jgi:hypothetical protein